LSLDRIFEPRQILDSRQIRNEVSPN
jgi:hypothetical protein